MVTTLLSCPPSNATAALVSSRGSYQQYNVRNLRPPTKGFPFNSVQVSGTRRIKIVILSNFNKSHNVNSDPSQLQQGAVLGPDGKPFAQGMTRREALLTSGSVGLSLVSPVFLPQGAEAGEEKSAYDFTVKYKEEDTTLQQYKGMVSVVLNIASA